LGEGLFLGGEAIVADAADFGAGNGDEEIAITSNLVLQLLVEMTLEFADFTTTQAGYVYVIARAVRLVIMAIAAKMKQVEFIDEAVFLQEIDGAVDGNEMHFRADFLSALEDLVHVEMLLGSVHDLKNYATLTSQPYATLAQGLLKMTGSFSRVDAFATGDSMGW
jgi:hypothetical protein